MRFTMTIEGDLTLQELTEAVNRALGRLMSHIDLRPSGSACLAVHHDGQGCGTLLYQGCTPLRQEVVKDLLHEAMLQLQRLVTMERNTQEGDRLQALVQKLEGVRKEVLL
jgi:hypothetical protein